MTWMIVCMLFVCTMGCGAKQKRFAHSFFDVFDTVTTVTVYAPSERAAEAYFDAVRDEMQTYHRLCDIYHDYAGVPNVKTVNNAAGMHPVRVDARLIDVVAFAAEAYELTDGRVNAAMGSVLSIWHDYRERGLADPATAAAPPMALLTAANAHTDIKNVVIDRAAGTLYLSDTALTLDLGAIAKGYAVQRAIERLAAMGAASAMINAGGNVCALGLRGDGARWKVGVQSPDGEGHLATLTIEGQSLVTSGGYQRQYTAADGTRYHHIIDPTTLMPAAYHQSVTVLHADSALADALSTALFNMPLADGLMLIDAVPDAAALWAEPDGEVIRSDRWPAG